LSSHSLGSQNHSQVISGTTDDQKIGLKGYADEFGESRTRFLSLL
jgi:hypothetical protein